jgi:hypothetical protein
MIVSTQCPKCGVHNIGNYDDVMLIHSACAQNMFRELTALRARLEKAERILDGITTVANIIIQEQPTLSGSLMGWVSTAKAFLTPAPGPEVE